MPNLSDLLNAMSAQEDEPKIKISLGGEIECLTDAYCALLTTHKFTPGMIIRQKPACRIYKDLGDNGIAIVIELLPEPILTGLNEHYGSDGLRMPVDMVVGEWRASAGAFVIHHVDSRRFEPS
jgi:hypothetical protein